MLSQEMMLHEDAAGLIRDLPRMIDRIFALDASCSTCAIRTSLCFDAGVADEHSRRVCVRMTAGAAARRRCMSG